MRQYVKEFIKRGLIFGGFGPIIMGIIFLILGYTIDGFSVTGSEVFIAIVSTYILAFMQAGASVFHQIESWSVSKALGWHFLSLYLCYIGAYLVNRWIPFEPMVLVIFTAIFAAGYFAVFGIVFFAVRSATKKMNEKLKQ